MKIYVKQTDVIPACREIDWIDYRMLESEGSEDINYTNWFAVALHVMRMDFKIIIQKKEVDFQSLVGYIGGYVGLFMGFALAQLPEIAIDVLGLLKHCQRYFAGNKFTH